MMSLLRIVLLSAAFALGTAVFGWWAVPLLGLAWGVIARGQRGAAVVAAVAAMLAWGGLLMRDASQGPVGDLAGTLGQLFGTSAVAVFALTIALPGLLALTAAIVGRAIRR